MALKLEGKLSDKPLDLVQKYLSAGLDDTTYDEMWKLLDSRFGGSSVEDAYIVAEFKKAGVLRNGSMDELKRMYDVFNVQSSYYKKNDAASLLSETSFITQMAREKLNYHHSKEFVKFLVETEKENCFSSILEWLKKKFHIAQITERQFCKPSSSRYRGSSHHPCEGEDDYESEYEDGSQASSWSNKPASQICSSRDNTHKNNPVSFRKFPSKGFVSTNKLPSKSKNGCPICKVSHNLTTCPKFEDMTMKERYFYVYRDKICFHCLTEQIR